VIKVKVKLTLAVLVLVLALTPPAVVEARKTYIGPATIKADVSVVESAGVDSSQPDAILPASAADSDGEYIFVKIDLSKLPPIDEIFITYTYLGFHIDSWSGSGVGGYASVATHFCGDNSWSASTLTWNNKPDHRKNVTDTWGFAFFYYGSPNLGFWIDEDVEEALRSGSKTLTEVVTWGSGSGHAGLSSPSIRIEYAKRPVCKVDVEARYYDLPEAEASEIDTDKMSKVASIKVSDTTLLNEETFYASPGTYGLQFTGRCKFLGWAQEGLSVGDTFGIISDPSQISTQVKVLSDGKLIPRCSFAWLIYGDTDEKPYSDMGLNATQKYAEMLEPLISGYLRLLRIYISKEPVPFLVQVLGMTDDLRKTSPTEISAPIKVTPTSIGWVELDLTPQNIKLDKDKPFYVSVTWLSDQKPKFGKVSGGYEGIYSVTNATEGWQTSYDNMLIQVIASTSLDEPVKFPVQPITTTTTTKITTTKPTTTRIITTPPTSTTKTQTLPTTTLETTVTHKETFTTKTTSYPVETTATVPLSTTSTTTSTGLIPGIDVLDILVILVGVIVVAVGVELLIRRRRKAKPTPFVLPPPPI